MHRFSFTSFRSLYYLIPRQRLSMYRNWSWYYLPSKLKKSMYRNRSLYYLLPKLRLSMYRNRSRYYLPTKLKIHVQEQVCVLLATQAEVVNVQISLKCSQGCTFNNQQLHPYLFMIAFIHRSDQFMHFERSIANMARGISN